MNSLRSYFKAVETTISPNAQRTIPVVTTSSEGGGGTGEGTPGGSDTHVQFNDADEFYGDPGFTYNKATNTVTITGQTDNAALVITGKTDSDEATITLKTSATSRGKLTGNATATYLDFYSSLIIRDIGTSVTKATITSGGNLDIPGALTLGTELAVAEGGTGMTTIPAGSALVCNTANTITALNSTSGTKYLQNAAGTLSWVTSIAVSATTGDTFTINSDLDNVTASLILGRTTGGSATLSWNGTTATFDKLITFSDNILIGNGKYLGQAAGGQLFFNDTSNYVYLSNALFGVGVTAPAAMMESCSTSYAQLRLTYTAGSKYCDFTVGSGGNLVIAPTGDLVLDPVGNDIYPDTNYLVNLGLINKKWLALHAAELWVETLVAQDTLATIGGRVLVGPTTYLTTDIATGATGIYTKHNNLAVGDTVYMEANGQVEFIYITGGPTGAGPYYYTVTRNRDGSGPNTWYAGDALFNTGAAGDGFIDIYSLRGMKPTASHYGPTIVGNVRNSATYYDWTEHWAIGNLNGIYGYGTDTYGVGLGKYSGADYVTIDTTNGIRFLDASDVVQAQLSSSVWTLGRVAASYGNIQITSGAVNFRTNTTNVLSISTAGNITFYDTSGNTQAALSSAVWTLGRVASGYSNIQITSGTLNLRTNTTNVISISTAGVATITLTGNETPANAGRIVFSGSSHNTTMYVGADGGSFNSYPSEASGTFCTIGTSAYPYQRVSFQATLIQLIEKAADQTIEFTNAVFYPATNNAVDLGTSLKAFQDVYAYTYTDVGDYYFLDDRDDLSFLNGIKGSGKYDDRQGLELIDDDTLPDFLISKHRKDVYDENGKLLNKKGDPQYSADGKPFVSIKALNSLLSGCIRQLDKKYEEHLTKFH
jgi:hypothetical protein